MKVRLLVRTLLIFALCNTFTFAQVGDQFVQTGNMNMARSGHTATLLKDGRVLIVGGDIVFPPGCIQGSSSAEIYDPATGQFTLTGSLNMDRVGHSAVLLDDGRVWIVGDYGWCSATEKTEFYDPATGSFSWGPDLPTAMGSSGVDHIPIARLSDGTVLVFDGAPYYNPNNRVWKFDPTLNAITEVGHTVNDKGWNGSEVTSLKTGEVALIGGSGAEIYDPATNTDRVVQNVPSYVPRYGGTVATLNDGRVVIFGGTTVDFQNARPLAIYDPATDNFTQVGDTLYSANGEGKGALLNDGRVLFSTSYPLGTLFLFNPTDNSMQDVHVPSDDTLANFSGWRTLTVLKDGGVLITGGANGYTHSLTSAAELFVPKTAYSCSGFEAPFNTVITMNSKSHRPIPLKAHLFDAKGVPVTPTSIAGGLAPVVFITSVNNPQDSSFWKSFNFDASTNTWWINLQLDDFWFGDTPGTYEVWMKTPDVAQYAFNPECVGYFVRK